MRTVGLTGGFGSGKSAAAKILGELGGHVIGADRLGHEAYRPGSQGWSQVVDAFGHDIVGADGTIDRRRLGEIVFADRAQLARLNAIVHPLIREAIRDQIAARHAAGEGGAIVLEAAVLIEAGWVSLVDEVWVIVAKREAIFERLAAKQGLDSAAIEVRLKVQLSDEERSRHADAVIDNNGTLQELAAQLSRLWRGRVAGQRD